MVELFNTVCEFQVANIKEAREEQKEKDLKYQEAVKAVGKEGYANKSNQTIVQKLQETSMKRWSVLNPDENDGDNSEYDTDGNIKI